MIVPPDIAIAKALEAAAHSPCHKSKRGVAAFIGEHEYVEVLDLGFNGPPDNSGCDGSEACRESCAKRCVHAEMRAIRGVARLPTKVTQRISLVHVKAVDGKLVAGGGPSCWQCSREIFDVGIGGVWLFEAQRWHDEVPCDTCNQKTAIAQGDGTDGVCKSCKPADRYPGLLELARTKTIYAPDSGEWRFYSSAEFHRVTLETCGIGGLR